MLVLSLAEMGQWIGPVFFPLSGKVGDNFISEVDRQARGPVLAGRSDWYQEIE